MYDDVALFVRTDLVDAHRRAWQRLAEPGTWHSGKIRVAIAAEVRNARECELCTQLKAALSPYTAEGDHDHLGGLPDPIVEVVHRIVTDPARLTRRWFETVTDAGLSDADYVEVVGVVAQVIALDTFAHGLGVAARSLPDACAGEPSRQHPHGVKDNGSWVPTIVPGDHGPDEADLFDGIGRSNIWSALSAVPHEMRGFFDVMNTQYLPGSAMRDFDTEYRAITHPQIELLASRVSAINQCFY